MNEGGVCGWWVKEGSWGDISSFEVSRTLKIDYGREELSYRYLLSQLTQGFKRHVLSLELQAGRSEMQDSDFEIYAFPMTYKTNLAASRT